MIIVRADETSALPVSEDGARSLGTTAAGYAAT